MAGENPNYLDHLVSDKIKCEPSSDNKRAPCCRCKCQTFPFIEESKNFLKQG